MEETLVENWNKTVKKGDSIYILGDFHWGKEDEWTSILKKLSGNKFLIFGNHDLKGMSKNLSSMFCDIKDYKEIADCGKKIIMCHYPILCYRSSYNPDVFMFHGHTHKTKEQDMVDRWKSEIRSSKTSQYDSCGNIFNVGCMLHRYTPKTAEQIIEEGV